jgi:hypothetical protein
VTARTPAGVEAQKEVPLTVSRTLGLVEATPALFSPNGDGRHDVLDLSFSLTVAADVRVRILREGRWVASPLFARFEPGAHRFSWNGMRAVGRLRDGSYAAVVEASDAVAGSVSVDVPFASDTVAPQVRFVTSRFIRLEVSEPGRLLLLIDGARVERDVSKAGVVHVRWEGAARKVRALAEDAAGNRSKPVLRVRGASTP